MPLKRSRANLNNISQNLKPLTAEAFRRGGGQNSRAYWILELRIEQFSCLKVEKKLQTSPLLWERIEHLTQSVKSVLGEGALRHCERSEFTPEAIQKNVKLVGTPANQNTFTPCHTAHDAVSHKLGMQDLLSVRHSRAKHGNPAFLNFPKISNKLDPQTTSEDDANLMCLMFTPAIAKVSRVRHTTPQPTTKEVLC